MRVDKWLGGVLAGHLGVTGKLAGAGMMNLGAVVEGTWAGRVLTRAR